MRFKNILGCWVIVICFMFVLGNSALLCGAPPDEGSSRSLSASTSSDTAVRQGKSTSVVLSYDSYDLKFVHLAPSELISIQKDMRADSNVGSLPPADGYRLELSSKTNSRILSCALLTWNFLPFGGHPSATNALAITDARIVDNCFIATVRSWNMIYLVVLALNREATVSTDIHELYRKRGVDYYIRTLATDRHAEIKSVVDNIVSVEAVSVNGRTNFPRLPIPAKVLTRK